MSTWETESFRGEHYQAAASLPGIDFETWRVFVMHTSVYFNGGTIQGYELERSIPRVKELHFPLGWAHELVDAATNYGDEFRRIFYEWGTERRGRNKVGASGPSTGAKLAEFMVEHQDSTWYSGLSSVIHLFTHADSILRPQKDKAVNYVMRFTKEAMMGLCEAPRFTPVVAEAQYGLLNGADLGHFVEDRLRAQDIRSLFRVRYTSAKRRRKRHNSHISARYLRQEADVTYIGPLTFITVEDKVFCLTTADIDRLQQCYVSRAMLHLYLATAPSNTNLDYGPLRIAVLQELKLLEGHLNACSYMEQQSVCKYYKKAVDLYQSYLAGELSDERRGELILDVKQAPHAGHYLRLVQRLRTRPLEIAQESGKIYRILCAPDYDIGEAFIKRAIQLGQPNPKGEHTHLNVPLDYDGFRKYHASMILDAACRMNDHKGVGTPLSTGAPPTWWGDWVEHGRRPGGIDWVDQFDWYGAVPYHERSETDPDVWRDSATCEENWAEVMTRQENSKTMPRNMLTRLLRDPKCPTPASARERITRGTHVLRAGFKMEAHKDVSRIFYIGNLTDRLFGSEIEDNITRVAVHLAGFTVGAKIADIITRIGRCYAPTVKAGNWVYHISSDYEAWSPGMHGLPQRISHENWAKLFGREELAEQRRINEYSYLLLNKRGYLGATRNGEANYEGLNGKEMTVIHCAFVGYAIYRAKMGGLSIPVADVAAFIDDGAFTLVLPYDPEHTTFRQFWEYFQETTAFLGYKLDKAKCFLSNRFLIYLNEVYYGGRHIAHGLRAVMRIGTRASRRGETITHILDAVGSGCRGAAKCGLSPVQIWKCAIICHAMETYLRYAGKYLDARSMVFFTYAPRILGGLQAPIGLTLDCNFSGSGATEALAYIKTYTKYNDDVRTWYLRLARTSVRAGSGESLIRNYRTVTAPGAQIKADYMGPAISLELGNFVRSPFGKQLMAYSLVQDDKDIGEAILTTTRAISGTVLALIDKSLISGVFNGFVRKFDSSSTMAKILGPRKIRDIEDTIANAEMEHIRTFVKRVRQEIVVR